MSTKKRPVSPYGMWIEARIMLVLEDIHPYRGKHQFSSTEFLLDEIDKTVASDKSKEQSEYVKTWSEANWFEKYLFLDRTLRRMVRQRKIKSMEDRKKDIYQYQLYSSEEHKQRARGSKIPKKSTK